MSSKWLIPKPLYEALPYAYPVVGVIAMLVSGNAVGVVSGVLLISAGGVIWRMRRNYRAEIAYNALRVAERQAHFGEEEGENLIRLAWRPAYETGHDLIDRQHRRLFSLGNELINATLTNKPRGDVELLLDDLVEDIGQHFQAEDGVVRAAGMPINAEHQAAHQTLLAEVKALRQRYQYGQLSVGELVGFIVHDVIAQHIIKEDLKFPPPAAQPGAPG